MRVIFMGTPDFAVETLRKLIEVHEVVGVFTQPDKPKGRGKKLTPPPVKEVAEGYSIPVFQPVKVREPEWVEKIHSLNPDVIVVVAYGQILSQSILDIPRYGCINVHASLLPKYRGAAPINWAIVHGETESGVTTMQMDAGLDTGDMLLKESVEITGDMTAQLLHDRLSAVGAGLLIETLRLAEKNALEPEKQNNDQSSYAPMMSKKVSLIDWTESARQISNKVRGFNPWPVAYTTYMDQTLKIYKSHFRDGNGSGKDPGTVVEIAKDSFSVATGEGVLVVEEIQWGSGKRMPVAAFLLGHKLEKGQQLGL